MTGRDPAVEAAQRAWGFESNWEFNDKTTGGMSVAAAREALKPIQDWLTEIDSEDMLPGHVIIAALAPLIYSDNELKDNP